MSNSIGHNLHLVNAIWSKMSQGGSRVQEDLLNTGMSGFSAEAPGGSDIKFVVRFVTERIQWGRTSGGLGMA